MATFAVLTSSLFVPTTRRWTKDRVTVVPSPSLCQRVRAWVAALQVHRAVVGWDGTHVQWLTPRHTCHCLFLQAAHKCLHLFIPVPFHSTSHTTLKQGSTVPRVCNGVDGYRKWQLVRLFLCLPVAWRRLSSRDRALVASCQPIAFARASADWWMVFIFMHWRQN